MSKSPSIALFGSEKRAASSLSAVYALRMFGMFIMLPVLAVYTVSLGGSREQAGLAIAAYGLTQAIFQLPLGIASDRFGRKKMIYLGLFVFAIGSAIAAWAPNVTWLIVGRATQGAGAVSAAVTALLADLTREEVRTRAMASIGLTIGFTFAASMVAAPLLTQLMGVKGIFWLTAILSLLAIAVVTHITPNAPAMFHEESEVQTQQLHHILKDSRLMRLNFGIFALQAVMMALFTSLPFALQHLGLDKTQQWKMYLPAVLLGLVLMMPAIIVGETRNKLKTVFCAGIATIAVALCVLATGLSSLWLIGLGLIIYFIGFNILEASLPSLVSKIAPSQLKGSAMGVYNTAQSIGVFTGGVLGGVLFARYDFSGVFTFAIGLTLIWLLVALTSPAPRPVKNVIMRAAEGWQGREAALIDALKKVEGVEAVNLSANGQTVYLKASQQGFNQSLAQQIITGEL